MLDLVELNAVPAALSMSLPGCCTISCRVPSPLLPDVLGKRQAPVHALPMRHLLLWRHEIQKGHGSTGITCHDKNRRTRVV